MQPRRGKDERGAIMLIAVFFAVFALALLYSVVGMAETVLFRERMQDAADAAALSGAVMHARGMNLLALINILMAALLAILVTIRLVEGLAIIGIAIAAALSWITAGGSLAAIPPLKVVQANMHQAYESTKPPVYTALEVLHTLSDAVKLATPAAAGTIVLADLEEHAKPPLDWGFAAGSRTTLPVEDDSFKELCRHAGELPVNLAQQALEPIGVGVVLDGLSGPMGSMASSLSEWFCGDGGSSPPGYQHEEDRLYPRMPLTVACECETKGCESGQIDSASAGISTNQSAKAQVCDEALRFEAQAAPDDRSGACKKGHDCSLSSPYEQRVLLAREQCHPKSAPAPFHYEYQVRNVSAVYTWTGKLWQRALRYAEPFKQSSASPPCGPKESRPKIAEGYNRIVRRTADVSEILAVCSTESAPEAPPARAPAGFVIEKDFTEVTHILGCKKRIVINVKGADDATKRDGGESRSSKRVESAATLGDENFQIRALVHGDAGAQEAGRIVRLALFNQGEPENPFENLSVFGGHAIAQAEYFYDGNEGRAAWMWNMKWRARLKRFRLPADEARAELDAACALRLGSCAGILSALSRSSALIAH